MYIHTRKKLPQIQEFAIKLNVKTASERIGILVYADNYGCCSKNKVCEVTVQHTHTHTYP